MCCGLSLLKRSELSSCTGAEPGLSPSGIRLEVQLEQVRPKSGGCNQNVTLNGHLSLDFISILVAFSVSAV